MKSETPFVGRYTMRQVVANVLAGCGRLLHERIILVLALMFCAGVAGVLWRVSHVQSNLIAAIALQNASLYSQALAEFRTLYTSEVVNTVTGHGIEVTHDYATKAGAIPLPVTLGMLLGQRLSAREPARRAGSIAPIRFPGGSRRVACKMHSPKKHGTLCNTIPINPFTALRTSRAAGPCAMRRRI